MNESNKNRNKMKKRFWKKMSVLMPKAPFWFKKFLAKLFVASLDDLTNDIVLYNELNLWIDTDGRPQTSNPNHWVNTYSK